MKFFYEIHYPYYAVIVAKNESQCLVVYTDIVSDVDDQESFFKDLVTLPEQTVINELAKTFDEDRYLIGLKEAERLVKNADFESGEVILMDGSLI